jgi:phosphoribosylanthranilate isomerase
MSARSPAAEQTHRTVEVKICGLTRAIDAQHASASGADYLGVIFAGGVRMQTVESAAKVFSATGDAQRVGVFGEQSVDDITRVAQNLELQVVQLHAAASVTGIETLRDRLGCLVWPVVRVEGTTLPPEALSLAQSAGWLLLDSKVSGHLGGTGVALDWAALASELRELRERVPDVRIVLAGGLRAGNVRHAIELLNPDVVDVSSGVEQAPGIKDPDLVQALITSAKS